MDDFESFLKSIDYSGLSEEQRRQARLNLEKSSHQLDRWDLITKALGELSVSWTHLDAAVDKLFQPLLNCTAEEVSCILVENVNARCSMLKRLIVVAKAPQDWQKWIFGLLDRISNEIGPMRNRLLHDALQVSDEGAYRIDKRPRLGRMRADQPISLSFNARHPVTIEDIHLLGDKMFTVSTALKIAQLSLSDWRKCGYFPQLDPLWLPASMETARCTFYRVSADELKRPLPPSNFEMG